MGNEPSAPTGDDSHFGGGSGGGSTATKAPSRGRGGTASILLESAAQTLAGAAGCGSLNDTLNDDANGEGRDDLSSKLLGSVRGAAAMTCVGPGAATPTNEADASSRSSGRRRRRGGGGFDAANSDEENDEPSAASALFARALVSEVTDNPKTMLPADMAEREKKLIRAQEKAKRGGGGGGGDGARPVGAPGGINVGGGTAGAVLGALQNFSLTGGKDDPDGGGGGGSRSAVLPPNPLTENRAQVRGTSADPGGEFRGGGKHRVTIGLSLSRRHSTLGHPDTVTRQTAFDFNELQDRQYKYVSSTDSSGWLAGGGERGGGRNNTSPGPGGIAASNSALSEDGDTSEYNDGGAGGGLVRTPGGGVASVSGSTTNNDAPGGGAQGGQHHKVAAPDTVHLPIIHIDCDSPQQVDKIIAALARGEIFIPHMSVLPESLSVNGISPPDLVVRFGCERNDDVPPDEWPNWCLEFMHNQLYEYFAHAGARWTRRPFQITLARKVRWRTVKHMNRFFAHSERVINGWRERGPQYLDPQLSYIEGGATPEEVARPHGIYLLRNGRPTNYFAPNFEPPYTTKMTRSLLLNVIGKSWDKKRRDWSSEPIPRLITPAVLLSTVCGCSGGDPGRGGFLASEATREISPVAANHSIAGRNGGSAAAPQAQGVSAEYHRSREEREEKRRRAAEAQEQERVEIEAQRASQRRKEEQQRVEIEASMQRRQRSLEEQRGGQKSERSLGSRGSYGGGSVGSAGAASQQERSSARSRSRSRDSSRRGKGDRRDHQEDQNDESSQQEEAEADEEEEEEAQNNSKPTRRERLKNRLHGRRLQNAHEPNPPTNDEDATPLIKNGSKEFTRTSSQSREDDDEDDDDDEDESNLHPLSEEEDEDDDEDSRDEKKSRDYHTRRPEPLHLDEPAPMTGPIEPVSPRDGHSSEPEGTPEAGTPERVKTYGSADGTSPEEAHLLKPSRSEEDGASTEDGEAAAAAASDPFNFDAFGSGSGSGSQHTGYSEDEDEDDDNEVEDPIDRARREDSSSNGGGGGRRQGERANGGLRTPPRLRPRFSSGPPAGMLGGARNDDGNDREEFGAGAVSSPSEGSGSDDEEPTTPLNYAGEESTPTRSSSRDNEGPLMPTAEHLSVGESHTTVPVMNSAPGKFIERERQRRKEREKEREGERRKMERLERAIEEQEKRIKSSKKDKKKSKHRRSSSKSRDQDDMEGKMALIARATADAAAETEKAREAVEEMQSQQREQDELERQQRNLQEEMDQEKNRIFKKKSTTKGSKGFETKSIARRRGGQQPASSSSSSGGTTPTRSRSSSWSKSSPRSSSARVSKSGSGEQEQPHEIEQNVSNDNSMEYSLESGMLGHGGAFANGGGTQLVGGDKSVVSSANTADDGSLLSYVTRSTMMGGATGPSVRKGGSGGNSTSPRSNVGSQLQGKIDEGDESGDDISLSLLESESEVEGEEEEDDGSSVEEEEDVPSDEELFAHGWAKALDPNSGSYYYYTLDRSQTVWDNPIGTIVPLEAESPPGAAPASSASSSAGANMI